MCPQVPVFVRAGAVIPTLPRNISGTPGRAAEQYHELQFQVWPSAGTTNATTFQLYALARMLACLPSSCPRACTAGL